MKYILALPLLASSALAHFTLSYPEWRGDSFADGADQWIFPCANVSQENAERTLWPLNGGSVGLELGHAWTYYSINLGLGNEVASFNITLTPELHNATGNGTLCIPKVTLPTGLVQEGQNATLQVVNFGASGSALYNCADITFSSEAVDPTEEQCSTNGIAIQVVSSNASVTDDHDHDHDHDESHETDTVTSPTPTPTGAAASSVGSLSFVGAVAAVVAAALGMI